MKPLHIGHSPDPDDAFMWYPLANFTTPDGQAHTPKIDTRGYAFTHVLEDIQSLNERSAKGELEITAISIHQYPFVADKYALTSCGSSMGDAYGPMIVSREPIELRELIQPVTTPDPEHRPKIAIPGERTTAWLALQLLMLEHGVQPQSREELQGGPNRSVEYVMVPFDQIIERVKSGEFTAGLIIHEGQITYDKSGLHLVVDLGKWWTESRGLPLPLGGNCIRRDLIEAGEGGTICRVLLDSIEYALEHRDEAVAFALNYARDMESDLADRFVGMYVNQWTLDYGERGRAAVRQLLKEAVDAGIVPALPQGDVDFVEPAPRRA